MAKIKNIMGLKMNWIMILGIILIAIGTFLTYLGSNLQSNKVSDEIKGKIQDTNAKIAALQKEPSINKEAVDKLDNEFSAWATELIKNKDSQRLHYEKDILDIKGKELSLSKEWLTFYNFFFETLKNLLDAYNRTAKNLITYEIPPLPNNLFSESINNFVANIKFSKQISWNIILSKEISEIPSINITVINESKNIGGLSIAPMSITDKVMYIFKDKDIFMTNDLLSKYDLGDYKNSLKTILKIIVEYQLTFIY